MKITVERLLLVIILGLLLFSNMCDRDKALFEYLDEQNKKIEMSIDSLKKIAEAQRDSVIRIDSVITVTKNHYIVQNEEIKKITTDSAVVALIRSQLAKLQSK